MEYGLRLLKKIYRTRISCLNPCFNGIWSATQNFIGINQTSGEVLILVLMEYGLRQHSATYNSGRKFCLNPCFNGIWSATTNKEGETFSFTQVLILVLMEYGLRQHLS